MAEIRVRQVPEELFNWLKAEAERRGLTMAAFVLTELWDKSGTKTGQKRDKLSHGKIEKSDAERDKPDPRHGAVRELIMKCHLEAFKSKCPWGAAEAGQLGNLLRTIPGVTVQELEVMVRNRFRSEGIAPDSPRVWLAKLTSYGAGPLDKFGKTKRPMKAAPTRYLSGMYSPEMEEKIRLANLDDDELKEKAN